MLHYKPFYFKYYRNQSGVLRDEKNIPASEQEKKEQAWFPAENVNQKRSQGSCFKKSQRSPLSFCKQRNGDSRSVTVGNKFRVCQLSFKPCAS